MNNHTPHQSEPRLDENPEPLRSQTSGRVAASVDLKCRYTQVLSSTPPGVDLHIRKDAKTLFDFRVSIPDETKVRHLRRNER